MKLVHRLIFYSLAAYGAVVAFHVLRASAAELVITSTTGDTRVFEVSGKEQKLIGTAPVTIKDPENYVGKVLLLEKPGYASIYTPIPGDLKSSTTISVHMKELGEWTPEEFNKKSIVTAENIVDQVLSIQALLDTRKVKEALPLAENLKAAYPTSVSVRLVYANALLLSGESAKADGIYTMLLDEIPDSRKYLKDSITAVRARLRGERVPASKAKGGR